MEFLDTVVGAVIAYSSLLLGERWARRKRPKVDLNAPVCGCNHHYSMHDPETKRCHGTTTERRYHYDEDGHYVLGYLPCTCRQYSGPEPLPEYF